MGRAVINKCYGGFGLTDLAKLRYRELTGRELVGNYVLDRHDPILLRVVEELGDAASCLYSKLVIAEFEGDLYHLDDYDGIESIVTPTTIAERWIDAHVHSPRTSLYTEKDILARDETNGIEIHVG
jgi:hypothetical protein